MSNFGVVVVAQSVDSELVGVHGFDVVSVSGILVTANIAHSSDISKIYKLKSETTEISVSADISISVISDFSFKNGDACRPEEERESYNYNI